MPIRANNRILMLLENQPYPQDHRVRREATTLAAAGYRVSVICPSSPGQSWRETVDSVRVYRFKAPPPANGFLGYFWEYACSTAAAFALSLVVFLTEGFDVIHAHNPPETFVLSPLSTSCSANVLYSIITIYPRRCIALVFQTAALPSCITPLCCWRDLLASSPIMLLPRTSPTKQSRSNATMYLSIASRSFAMALRFLPRFTRIPFFEESEYNYRFHWRHGISGWRRLLATRSPPFAQ